MKANRYLGTSADLPSSISYTSQLADIDVSPIDQYAFPGGYEIVIVCADGSEVCVPCANRYISERVAAIGEVDAGEVGEWTLSNRFASSEILAGCSSMAETDSCVICDDCGTYVSASGCEEVCATCSRRIVWNAEHGREMCTAHPGDGSYLLHGEYCSHYAEPCITHARQHCSDPQCIGNVLLAELRTAERDAGTY